MTQPAEPTRIKDAHRAIGELLLQARIDGGLTAHDVCELTRITPEMLRRVEAGQFEQCGGDIYARGHIRAYAGAVGLDPEPLLVMYGLVHLPPLTKRDLRKPRTVSPNPGPARPAKGKDGKGKDGRGRDRRGKDGRGRTKGKDG
ncbi:MAG TPA: helix-turn-helix domain-containing protein, partial [Actinospica sp.]|nr:helix-turn-helix domain-containing protein [Actinospica sp.]